jgi:hypothetical protein
VFAEKPVAFAGRVAVYWRVWRQSSAHRSARSAWTHPEIPDSI